MKLTVIVALPFPCHPESEGEIIPQITSNENLRQSPLKHAFPAGQPVEVHVEVGTPDGQEVTIVVRDTGVGFPEDLDFRHTASLGLQLVGLLTEQLQRTIELTRRPGTTFILTFPIRPAS